MFNFFSKSKNNNKPSSSKKFSERISEIFKNKNIDDQTIDELEELMLVSDINYESTSEILDSLSKQKFPPDISDRQIKEFLADKIAEILKPRQSILEIDTKSKPQVIIFNGVNGSGKTTTIGKIASNLTNEGKKVLIAACDTFRAGAVLQIAAWAKRSNCEIITAKKENEDPASIAYRALEYAQQNNFDILLIDTAGRLQNKQNLIDELKKINKVIQKLDSSAPHENILVIDGTTGQNSISQTEIFNQAVSISGIIITKLDGSAKGGVVISIAKKFAIPIYALGLGEKISDLQDFDAVEYSKNLLGIS